jgi:hypothetical protein
MDTEQNATVSGADTVRAAADTGTALVPTDQADHTAHDAAETEPQQIPEGHGQTNAPRMTHPADLSRPVLPSTQAPLAPTAPLQGSPIPGMNMDPIGYDVVARQERTLANPTGAEMANPVVLPK